MTNQHADDDAPYIPANRSLPEITVRAILLGIFLSIVLAAANTYLGLFAGMTVSASIPAAVMSMAILRFFRNSNILENNIVQTAASAGESLAAGVIFTIPALLILKAWTHFDWLQLTFISGLGGLLGVLFTIPLRRALIVENPLRYPEGVATAEVLKAGDRGVGGIKLIAVGGGIGALFKFGASALRLWGETLEGAQRIGGSIAYFGTNLSPALIGVGYIVGFNISVLIALGGAINWLVAIPIFAGGLDWPVYQNAAAVNDASWKTFVADDPALAGQPVAASDWAWTIWSKQTRYLGVGAMVVGGIWALVSLRGSLLSGVRSGIEAYRESRRGRQSNVERTERDTPMPWVGTALVISVVPLALLFYFFTKSLAVASFMAAAMLIAAFLFSAVAAYMAGLVGSSNNPISGVTIATILTSALLLLGLSKMGLNVAQGAASAILIGAVVCCACAIGGDNMQDLKTGRIVGATPYKQQIMQGIGVLSAAVVMAPVLSLLQHAYGIGIPTEEHPRPLAAPQATLMASVAGGVFQGGLPMNMILIGAAIAVGFIILDLVLEKQGRSFRTPVLAVAVGIYLPFELSVPIFIGGMIAWIADRVWRKKDRSAGKTAAHNGLLFSSGLITGEALMGIGIAALIVAQKQMGFDISLELAGTPIGKVLGLGLLVIVSVWLYRVASRLRG